MHKMYIMLTKRKLIITFSEGEECDCGVGNVIIWFGDADTAFPEADDMVLDVIPALCILKLPGRTAMLGLFCKAADTWKNKPLYNIISLDRIVKEERTSRSEKN